MAYSNTLITLLIIIVIILIIIIILIILIIVLIIYECVGIIVNICMIVHNRIYE